MSDIHNEFLEARNKKKRVCRVAYTLNNTQPVICTIIGDQPLFYMDFESSAEAVDAQITALGEEIDALRNEIDQLERFSTKPLRESTAKLEEFIANKKSITSGNINFQSQNIENLKTYLRQSRLASAYLDCASEHHVNIEYSRQIETAQYDRKAGLILVNPALVYTDQILLLAQELRRHWQHRQGALIHPLMFHPDNAILINRVQMADLMTSVVRIAWELQLSGEKQAWERIEQSSLADLGRAFAREAFLDFRTINNGLASAAVFECWFLSERCRIQDKNLINQMLCDYQGYVFELDQTQKGLTPSLISALGTMPFGKNYLAEHAVTIMNDTIFTDVRDRSNANFLWFIKFERSFRESEQELQIQSASPAMDTRSNGASQNTQDLPDEAPAQIIPFYAGNDEQSTNMEKSGRLLPRGTEHTGGKRKPSNVVYIRRWSGE